MFDYHLQQPKYSPFTQLAFLLMLCGVGLLIGTMVSIFIAQTFLHIPLQNLPDALKNADNANLSRTLQIVSTFFFMALPSIIFGVIINRRQPLSHIGFNNAVSGKQVLLIIAIAAMSLGLSGALSEVNEIIPISKSSESYFRSLEDEYSKEVLAIANMKTWWDYLASLLIIALLPAIFEEMIFRGALQPIMIGITKNAFVGILITSILFSAIHASYYGFLPRLALGLIIGYVFYYSKNLWLSSLTHFLYNAVGVTQLYLVSREGKLTQESLNDQALPFYYGLIAALIIFFLFYIFKRESQVVISMHNLNEKILLDAEQ